MRNHMSAARVIGGGRRGAIAVVLLIVLVVLQLVVVGMVIGGARDQDVSGQRVDAVRAQYAAEGGMNMAIREVMDNADEDGDGTIGTISNDGNAGNDPTIGTARVSVSKATVGMQTTYTSKGRSNGARRQVQATSQ